MKDGASAWTGGIISAETKKWTYLDGTDFDYDLNYVIKRSKDGIVGTCLYYRENSGWKAMRCFTKMWAVCAKKM